MDEDKKFERTFGVYEKIIYLSDLLKKQSEIRNMLDMRTNMILGFDTALIVLFIANFKEGLTDNIAILLGLITLLLSLLFAILALKPPTFITKKGQCESSFYHHFIASKSQDAYRKIVYDNLDDENQIFDAYILEVHNISKYSNIPRKFYLNLAVQILIFGILISLLSYLIVYILNIA